LVAVSLQRGFALRASSLESAPTAWQGRAGRSRKKAGEDGRGDSDGAIAGETSADGAHGFGAAPINRSGPMRQRETGA
jgi:hypothetical protein